MKRLTTTKKLEPELFKNLKDIDENKYFLKVDGKSYEDTIETVADKLGELEDIEEELGIDLVTLFKALKNGAWFKYDYDGCEYIEAKRLYLRTDIDPCAIDYLENVEKHYLKDYGKTWALTKEELDNEIHN